MSTALALSVIGAGDPFLISHRRPSVAATDTTVSLGRVGYTSGASLR
jgi:hypothetical protein